MSATPVPLPVSRARIRHLDGLRGFAITLVLLYHFVIPLLGCVPASFGAYLGAALTLTYTGVDLFFVLSGYLIGGILLDHRTSPRFCSTFYARRAARIVPLAFLCIAAILGAQATGLYGPPQGGSPWSLGVYASFVSNLWMAGTSDWGYRPLSHLWSLGIEEQFYLVAPFLIRALYSARIVWLLLALVVLAPLLRLGLLFWNRDSALAAGMLPFCRMDSLGAGLIVAWLVRHTPARIWCERRRGALFAASTVLTVGCVVLTWLRAANGGFAMAAGGYTVVAAFYATVLLMIETRRDGALSRLLSLAPLVLLGRFSYFLYLFQGLVIGLTVGVVFQGHFAVVTPETWLQVAVGTVALLVVAYASWHWFESPLLALGRRLAY